MHARPTPDQLAVLDDDGNPWRPEEDDTFDEALRGINARLDALTCAMQANPFVSMGVGLGLGLLAGFIHGRLKAA